MPFIVMRLQRKLETTLLPVSVVDGDHLGMLSVYKTKKAAREVWGKDVKLVEIEPIVEVKK